MKHPFHPTTEKLVAIAEQKTARVQQIASELYIGKNRLTGETLTPREIAELTEEFEQTEKVADAINLLLETPNFIEDLTRPNYAMER